MQTAFNFKILVVDDDISIRRALTLILQEFGRVLTAESGNQAIGLLEKERFDLILTDYEMQQGNGLELLAFLQEQGTKTPVVMITAFGTKDLMTESVKNRIFGLIEKPFNQESIVKMVREALELNTRPSK